MANNKCIQILRGKDTYNPSASNEILLDGQPFYSKQNKKLYIGDGSSTISQLSGTEIGLPIKSGKDSIIEIDSVKVKANPVSTLDGLEDNTAVLGKTMSEYVQNKINTLDVESIGDDTGFLQTIRQEDGKIIASKNNSITNLTVTTKATLTAATVSSAPTDDESVLRKKEILEWIYPVGAIFISVQSTNPSSYLGGTWEQIQDAYLFAKTDTDTAGAILGSYAITHANLPAHEHALTQHIHSYTPAVSINSAMSDENYLWGKMFATKESGGTTYSVFNGVSDSSYTEDAAKQLSFIKPSNDSSFSQYTPVYNATGKEDRNLAGIQFELEHTHSITSTAQTTNKSDANLQTGSAGSAKVEDFKPKYVAVYVWKRTA